MGGDIRTWFAFKGLSKLVLRFKGYPEYGYYQQYLKEFQRRAYLYYVELKRDDPEYGSVEVTAIPAWRQALLCGKNCRTHASR